jgi:PadR family transcriptional regulator, regulatory protein PadR
MDTTQLLKGVLDVAVLAVIRDEDGYGYDIVRRLRAAGIDEVGDASVYGTLRRLYAAGMLSSYVVPSEGGPHRKYYGINAEGTRMLAAHTEDWEQFAGIMSGLLGSKRPARTAPVQIRKIGEKA